MTNDKDKVEEFWKLCAETVIVYKLFVSLFEIDQKQRDLLSSVAPYCFGDLNNILHQYALLQFAKLTDPAKTGRNYNLTTNYILTEIRWPDEVRLRLTEVNSRLMGFRKYIEEARSKRIAHTDLNAQLLQRASLGGFPKDTEQHFLRDLQEFVNIAHGHFDNGNPLPIDVAMATDTHKLVRALEKSVVFDRCVRCSKTEKAVAVLDFAERLPGT